MHDQPADDDHDPHDHHHDHRSFDERARDWDDEDGVARARQVAAAIRAAVAVDATTRALEYGAGTGLATQLLAADGLGAVVLADPSTGMREVMAEKVADGRLPRHAEVVDLDLTDPSAAAARRDSVDLALMVMALHHVPDPRAALAGLATVLAPGGHLCVVDLDAGDGSFHGQTSGDVHDGFDRDELAVWLGDAGLVHVGTSTVHRVVRNGRSHRLFLAVARHPQPSGAGDRRPPVRDVRAG